MALTIHVLLILVGLVFTAVVCRLLGTKPTVKRALRASVIAFLLGNILAGPAVFSGGEGTVSPLPWLMGVCLWLILALLPTDKKGFTVFVVVSALFIGLVFQHTFLAHTPEYTDNPQLRQRGITILNQRAAREGKPPLPNVQITAGWYTPFTGLYRVEPPVPIY